MVGPDATDRRGSQVPADGPAFLYFLIEAVKAKHAVDGRRMYLFGHLAGASFALTMGFMESECLPVTSMSSRATSTEAIRPAMSS
jgi:poly(3-hydroxybutyrate) depolymerase